MGKCVMAFLVCCSYLDTPKWSGEEEGRSTGGEGKIKGSGGRGDKGKELAHPKILAWRPI